MKTDYIGLRLLTNETNQYSGEIYYNNIFNDYLSYNGGKWKSARTLSDLHLGGKLVLDGGLYDMFREDMITKTSFDFLCRYQKVI